MLCSNCCYPCPCLFLYSLSYFILFVLLFLFITIPLGPSPMVGHEIWPHPAQQRVGPAPAKQTSCQGSPTPAGLFPVWPSYRFFSLPMQDQAKPQRAWLSFLLPSRLRAQHLHPSTMPACTYANTKSLPLV